MIGEKTRYWRFGEEVVKELRCPDVGRSPFMYVEITETYYCRVWETVVSWGSMDDCNKRLLQSL